MQNSTQTATRTIPEVAGLLKLNPRQSDNFWKKVNKDGPIPSHRPDLGKCWAWTGATFPYGYGCFRLGKTNDGAHRISWSESNGKSIPNGMCICHHCDNPPCCNPSHLFIGTKQDNVTDKVSKGRHRVAWGKENGKHTHPESTRRGESHPNSKLKEVDVIRIKQLLKEGGRHAKIAAMFGVYDTLIYKISIGESWKHVQ